MFHFDIRLITLDETKNVRADVCVCRKLYYIIFEQHYFLHTIFSVP